MDKEKKKRPDKPRGPTSEPPEPLEAAHLEVAALRAELGLPTEPDERALPEPLQDSDTDSPQHNDSHTS